MTSKPYNASSSSLADFKQLALLGEGAYSTVYKAMRLADSEIYAVKKVKLPSLSDKEKQNALNEVRLLASVHSEHIIAYKEAFFDDKTRCLCIVMEFSDSGDLFQQITKCQKEKTHMREADVWRYIGGMAHGLKALHDMRILHRDLKCANVFLSTKGADIVAMLGDFNVSKVAKRGLCMTQTGTPYYASPEVWRDMPYDAKSDMWSLGCVIYEMVALRPPFRAEDMEGLYRKVLRGQYPRIPQHFSHDLSEVIGVLLQVNPQHRPSVDQLLQMPVMRRHAAVDEPHCRASDLLQTIKLPKNVIDISDCLPGPQYDMNVHFGSYSYDDPANQPQPLPQESAGDVAGGTSKLPPLAVHPGMAGRGQPLATNPEQDSLDVILAAPTADQRKYDQPHQVHQAHVVPAARENQRQGQLRPVAGADSLDAYLQQQSRLPRQRADQVGDYAADAVDPRSHHPSPTQSSHARLPPPAAQAQAQYRHPRGGERKPMASYARAQYSLGTGGAAVPQPAPPRQPTGGGLRLPRIFSRGG